jgi:transposase
MPDRNEKQVEQQEKFRKMRVALERRLKKVSYRAIADELGVSVSTITIWVKEMTQTMLPQDEVEALRAHEAAGLDESEQRIMGMMQLISFEAERRQTEGLSFQPQIESYERYETLLNNVRKQRAMLLGINVPMRVKHNITIRTEFDAEVEALCSDLLGGGNLMTGPDMIDVGEDDA